MTDEKILEKAIRIVYPKMEKWVVDYSVLNWQAIVYDKDFAKALWGEEDVTFDPSNYTGTKYTSEFKAIIPWQYHLQQMVISDDPIKYLGEHLDA